MLGKCCKCCLTPGDYPTWDEVDRCCRKCKKLIDSPWVSICSDPIRTDTRFAEAEYKYYVTPFPVIIGQLPPVFPPCTGNPKELCATVTETHLIEIVERLVLRYRIISRESFVTKVKIRCGDEDEKCQWVISSNTCLEVFYGQVEFYKEDHVINGLGSSCCSIANVIKDLHIIPPTCEERANMALPSSATVYIKRTKVSDVKPSGVITFDPADRVVCEPVTTCLAGGVLDFEIVSTDFGTKPWNPPVCNTIANQQTPCFVFQYLVSSCCDSLTPGFPGLFPGQTVLDVCSSIDINGNISNCECVHTWDGMVWVLTSVTCDIPPETVCRRWNTGTSAIVINSFITGELLTVQGVNGYSCTILCQGERVSDKYNSAVECLLLSTPFHPNPTYTERRLKIDLPAWDITLDSCE